MRARTSLGFLAHIRRDRPEDTGGEKHFPGLTWVRGATVEEVYAPGKWNSHLSDDVTAFALAQNAADRQAPHAAGGRRAEDVVRVEVAAPAHLRPGRTSTPGGRGGADGRGGDA